VLEDNDGSARGPTQSDKEPLIPPGVFQMGQTPDVYPEGLNRPLSKEEPWSGSDTSRWMPNGTSKSNSTQTRGTAPLTPEDNHTAQHERRAECLIKHLEALLIAISNLTRAKMASYIPEHLTDDKIRRLMVSAEDSRNAIPIQSPHTEGVVSSEGRFKELTDERIAQLDKVCQDVIL
jgi:hypothetical protein